MARPYKAEFSAPPCFSSHLLDCLVQSTYSAGTVLLSPSRAHFTAHHASSTHH